MGVPVNWPVKGNLRCQLAVGRGRWMRRGAKGVSSDGITGRHGDEGNAALKKPGGYRFSGNAEESWQQHALRCGIDRLDAPVRTVLLGAMEKAPDTRDLRQVWRLGSKLSKRPARPVKVTHYGQFDLPMNVNQGEVPKQHN